MLIITSSSQNKYKRCHRAYYYSYDQCLKPRRTSWPLIDGQAFHLALERYYGDGIMPGALKGTEAEKNPYKPIYDLIDVFYEQARGGGPEDYEDYETTKHKTIVKAMFEGYSYIYPPNEFEEISPEVKFKVEINNPLLTEGKFILAGKTDAHVKQNSKPYLFETKTTSESSMAKFLERLLLADQPNAYLYGFNRMGTSAVGVIYNIVRKCALRQGKHESDKAFLSRIRQAYLDDVKAVNKKYYHREIIYRSPVEIEEYLEELKQITKDMSAYYAYKSPDRCFDFGGCEFMRLCQGGDVELDFIKKKAQHEELMND